MPKPYLVGWKDTIIALLKALTKRRKQHRKMHLKMWLKRIKLKYYWKTNEEISLEMENAFTKLRESFSNLNPEVLKYLAERNDPDSDIYYKNDYEADDDYYYET